MKMIRSYKKLVKQETGNDFPQDPHQFSLTWRAMPFSNPGIMIVLDTIANKTKFRMILAQR